MHSHAYDKLTIVLLSDNVLKFPHTSDEPLGLQHATILDRVKHHSQHSNMMRENERMKMYEKPDNSQLGSRSCRNDEVEKMLSTRIKCLLGCRSINKLEKREKIH